MVTIRAVQSAGSTKVSGQRSTQQPAQGRKFCTRPLTAVLAVSLGLHQRESHENDSTAGHQSKGHPVHDVAYKYKSAKVRQTWQTNRL